MDKDASAIKIINNTDSEQWVPVPWTGWTIVPVDTPEEDTLP